jgi:hypothetical protein
MVKGRWPRDSITPGPPALRRLPLPIDTALKTAVSGPPLATTGNPTATPPFLFHLRVLLHLHLRIQLDLLDGLRTIRFRSSRAYRHCALISRVVRHLPCLSPSVLPTGQTLATTTANVYPRRRRFPPFQAVVFYDPDMAMSEFESTGTDAILRHIDAEAGSVSIEVTLYLPWGVATGITVPREYFGHYVAKFFTSNDAEDVGSRVGVLEAEQERVFLHLRKARCYVAGTVVEHDSLRIRLSDVSAWTVAGIRNSKAEPSPIP